MTSETYRSRVNTKGIFSVCCWGTVGEQEEARGFVVVLGRCETRGIGGQVETCELRIWTEFVVRVHFRPEKDTSSLPIIKIRDLIVILKK